MKRTLLSLLLPLSLFAGTGAAQACRIRVPPPPVVSFPYQALAIGTATRIVEPRIAEVRVDRIIDGHSRTRRLRLDASFVNSCAPFYGLNAGDRLFLVLQEGPIGPAIVSWVPLDVARQREPWIADYLAARSLRERLHVVARWREQHAAELAAPQ